MLFLCANLSLIVYKIITEEQIVKILELMVLNKISRTIKYRDLFPDTCRKVQGKRSMPEW